MEFRILGPLEVVDGDARIEISGTKLRALLALLLLHPNEVMSTDRLVDGLWGEAPPQTAPNTLQTHVSHLRKALAPMGAGDNGRLVLTKFPGYVLAVDPERIDVGRFERLAQEGRRAVVDAAPQEAVVKLTEALSLWRGPALADFAFEPFASSEAGRLEELRLAVVADRTEAELALGHHEHVVGELRQLVDEHPLRERLWAQLMTALYRCGRQADALRAFTELRRVLGDELGIEPSHELQRLEEAILLQKPELDWRPPAVPVAQSQPVMPVQNNLPVQLTSFVGRERELEQVTDALVESRLVTLCGPGGVGKTRLALAAAGRVLDEYPDGAFLIELAPLSDPALVAPQTLSALGLTDESRPPLDALVDHLRQRRLLLVLDNCEHVLSACAVLADTLLRACPGLRIVATSREPLHAAAETTIAVPPLPIPDQDVVHKVDAVGRYEAVQLFLARARSVRPGFHLSEDNAAGVARICRRLDGIPLALELAAARTRALSPEEIAERLDDRFRLLSAGTTTAPARHQTLRAAVDWTNEALSETERLVFNRLSVFAGTFSVEDAEDVCGLAPVAESEMLNVLLALVDKSLVVADGEAHSTRYRMLETLRHYAGEKLMESGEHDEVWGRLLQWGMVLAETAEPNLEGRDQTRWLDLLEAEHDNLRAALSWGTRSDVGGALRLAAALWRFWEVRGYLTEGRQWLERLLAVPGEVAPLLRAKALNSAGVLAQRQSAYPAAQAMYEASLSIRRELQDRRGMAAALHGMGNLAGLQGDHRRGEALFEESLDIGRAVGEPRIVAAALTNLGWLGHERGDLLRARQLLRESLEIYSELRDGHGAANCLHRLGAIAQSEGDWAAARSLYEESFRMQRELGERYGVVWSLSSLADVSQAEGDSEAAGRLLEDVLLLSQELGNKYCETITLIRLAERASSAADFDRAELLFKRAVVLAERLGDTRSFIICLQGLAQLARVEGHLYRAARLLAAAQAFAPGDQGALVRNDRDEDDNLVALREGLGEARFLTAWMAGRSMDTDEAARYAAEGRD